MAKFIVLYEEPKDKSAFEKYYQETHVPLVNEMPHIKKLSVDHVVKTDNAQGNFYLHVEIEFGNLDQLNESLSSEAGKRVMADAANLAPFLISAPQVLITH